jgi:hypothetical protein
MGRTAGHCYRRCRTSAEVLTVSFVDLSCVTRFPVRLVVGAVSSFDSAYALQLGVEFGTEQDRDIRNPQPPGRQ